MNLSALAKLAGVSVSTVSKAFHGSKDVSDKTKQRIFDIARENGCFERYDRHKFSKKVIAVICPELKSEYYSDMLSVIDELIKQKGGVTVISISDFSEEKEQELFSYYAGYGHADGVIFLDNSTNIQNTSNFPLICFIHESDELHTDNICLDKRHAVLKALTYLKKNGHTDIGFIGEQLTNGKKEVFVNAMRKIGLPVLEDNIYVSHKRFEEAGAEGVSHWLKQDALPTAIITGYDYIAIGAIEELQKAGLSVPKDCSVIGMDDIGVIPHLNTPISSIKTNVEQMCQAAVDLIYKKINNQYYSSRKAIRVDTEFILRESVGPCPKEKQKKRS